MGKNRKNRSDMEIRGYCAYCGAVVLVDYVRDLSIEWNDQKKEFRVNLSINCDNCGSHLQAIIKKIPLEIESESTCSCGERLSLSDYSIKYIGNDFVFYGIYSCEKCNNKTKTTVSKLQSSVKNFWRDTNKIEIGPTGIKYEKK